ncbi:MAG: ABC1 kinase family protein, partial [Candidatus Nanopelagicales bacterium]
MIETEGSVWDLVVLIALIFLASLFMGWLSARILDVRRGRLRSLAAGVAGFFGGLILLVVQVDGNVELSLEEGTSAALTTLLVALAWLGYALIVALVASLVIDAMLRPRRGRHRFPRPIRAIKARIAVTRRLTQIARIARRNGLIGRRLASRAELLSPETARALRLTLEESGGMLVKFGQIASTRDDLLPPVITDELAQLRSSVPGLPFPVVRQVIETELGASLDTIFESVDEEPLAAASIGVTHRAVLKDGRRVIVKVQRPDVQDSVAIDGRVLVGGARSLERQSAAARRVGVVGLARELVSGITEELDFTREAANNAAMRRARAGDDGVRIPEIYADLTTRRVLIMDEVKGASVSDQRAVDECGAPRVDLARALLDSFLSQILVDGVYHADPHPGNVLVDRGGTLWFIDFGAVGWIDPVTLEGLQQMALGFTLRDPSVLARAVRRVAGQAGENIDITSLEFDLGVVLTTLQGGSFDPAAISEIIRVLDRHGVGAPPSLTILARAILTLDGTLRSLDPDFRMGPAAQAKMGEIVSHSELDPRDQLTREVIRALPVLRAMPQVTEDLALQARSGRLTVRIDRFSGPDGHRVEHWLNRVLFTVIGIFGLVGSGLVLIAGGLDANDTVANPLRLIGFVGLFLSATMMMRVVAQILARRDD